MGDSEKHKRCDYDSESYPTTNLKQGNHIHVNNEGLALFCVGIFYS